MFKRLFLLISMVCLIVGSCAPAQPLKPMPPAPENKEQGNLTSTTPAKVSDQAYSNLKTELRHAEGFTVEYIDNYKVLKIVRPWRGAETTFTYVLVQRGTKAPETIPDAQVIEVPVKNMASLAATHLAYLGELGALEHLIAIGNTQYVNTESVRKAVESGTVQPVGNGPDINLEKLLALNPELVTTFAMGKTNKDDYQQLMQKGIKTLIFSDYMETTPLGRAEWLKCMALFFNKEAEAEKIFSEVEKNYLDLKAKTESISSHPSVLLGFEINGSWNMPGGKSHQATYIADAGGNYLWGEDKSSGRIPLSFEKVLERGAQAEYWFDQSLNWTSAHDLAQADPRYAKILAFERNQVYNNNASLGPGGGNLYNETGIVHPERVLADLISILHPELLPGHQLTYYRHLNIKEN
ncbi:MAG: ABC transporter substrate-binding protein [Anaerolineaceae bacterium]|nr:ABC transporter substrate-binding protein [Anaerolineaceae bacterium]